MQKKAKILKVLLLLFTAIFGVTLISAAASLNQQLADTAIPYVKYFRDRAITTSDFAGFTRSFQLYLGGQNTADQAMINYGAANYDQSILARISLAGGNTTILDTYINYYNQISNPDNPLLNCNGNYTDAANQPLKYGPYRIVRILGRGVANWWTTWDWIVDTGAAACLAVDASSAFQQTQNTNYKNFAILLADYILKLQDNDGGIRYGPRKMYHDPEPQSDFYWNLKSTEQNERALCALEALYTITADTRYVQSADKIKNWLKSMYDKNVHLYHSASTYNGASWVNNDFGYVATDVMAFAPLDLMFTDSFFGATQALRDTEVDAMFAAIEQRTAFLNQDNLPIFFKFSISQQTGLDYGSVEFSSQMALAYLRGAQIYAARSENAKMQTYLNKYRTLVNSLEGYFIAPIDDPAAKVAPYASYLNKSVAGNLPTGTGYYTYNCQAALASAYFAFAKAGYLPSKLDGGTGIPASTSTLNLSDIPWYQNTAYNSTGAAVAQMILNYLRVGAGQPTLTQNEIYTYARSPDALGPDLTADQMDKVLGHFDPYDTLVSNSQDSYDSVVDGNPYQGYNFSVDTYDPLLDSGAMNKYLRDICHWMAYTVTKENWWGNGTLVARPNTPTAVPIYGTYNHWVVVKGFSTSADPCPEPHTNPMNVPDFTVYGFWIKDPLTTGLGQDTYKTAAECQSTYFLPLSSADTYQGKLIQVAEPPAAMSKAKIIIPQPNADPGNLNFIGVKNSYTSGAKSLITPLKKNNWRDILDARLLTDNEVIAAFKGTRPGIAILVKRLDKENANYYLLPFGKYYQSKFLSSGVIILDAKDGHFKEASWTKQAENFPKVNRQSALALLRAEIIKNYGNNLATIPKKPLMQYLRELRKMRLAYNKLLNYLNRASTELIWEANKYSASMYKPYWKINANGYIWYVTQEKKIIAESSFRKILAEIKNNL